MAIYQRLKAWQRSHDLCLAVFKSTRFWPPEERFGLTSQARRAAHSVPANIAEGCAKKGRREFRRYLNISLGSLSELSYTLFLAKDLGILSQEEWGSLEELHQRAGSMTWLLYRSLLSKTPCPADSD
ncbi:MAG: four helix bundle protein [Gemmatimonadales bacterium]